MRFPCKNWWFAARGRSYTNAGSYKRHKGLRTGYRENAAEAVTDTKALGAWVVVAEQTTARAGLSGDSSDGRGARWRLADVVEAADAAVVIPMLGMANSLNVATAAAILSVASGLPPSPAARVSTAPASEKKSKSGRQPAGSPGWLKATPERKVSYPQGSELSEDRLGGENFASVFWDKWSGTNEPRCSHGRGSRSVCA